ncbi:hypothetical protein MARLIPOL_18123 [Marinobacter lipolyticus SM19]|uniref:Uncharacterized protein n=1 Tax=Marinobacter lipolyticus SM19 TaxID=1318628 RepID=R8AW55_9GAMM|nr:hypothetical protein [Marinobacter lipolyticus]EON90558.1 hypothetical protein MARLIPOL_18123 [Marinobacter lipolyticus SM19]
MAITPVESFARIGTFSYLYAEATEKGYSEFLATSEEIEALDNVEYDERLGELEHARDLAAIQAIVFSAMCFEAAIYDFASIHLGDGYVQDHLDKLDVLSKWLVVIRFVSGIEIPKSEAPYAALKNLVFERNRLVHSKSEPMSSSNIERHFEKMEKREREFVSGVHDAFRAIVLMSLYLDKVLHGYHNPLPSFSKRNAPLREYYSELEEVIHDCRRVIARI